MTLHLPYENDESLMFVGDTHGDFNSWGWLFYQADKFEVKTVYQLGDFGYWEHTPDGVHYLDLLEKDLAKNDRTLIWIDGNHENHTLLQERYPERDRFHAVRPHISYAPRGLRWIQGGVSFLAAGGAYSIDKEWRVNRYEEAVEQVKKIESDDMDSLLAWAEQHRSWFPEEAITDEDVERCCEGGQVDVVLAHDVFTSCDISLQFSLRGGGFLKYDPESNLSRHQCEMIFRRVLPKWWIHGHYHLRYNMRVPTIEDHTCDVIGLGKNGQGMDHFTIMTAAELADGAPVND